MQYPDYDSTGNNGASGGTAAKPLFKIDDVLPEKNINQIIWSLMALLEQAGVTGKEFDQNDPTTYNRLLEAINDLQASREVGKLGFRICDPDKLPQLAPNELVPAGQILNRSDYPKLWDYIANSGCVVSDSQWQQAGMEAFFSWGNGSTTFRPGNLVTGVFPRFIDLSSLYDPDREGRTGGNKPGSWQNYELQSHSHRHYSSDAASGEASYPFTTHGNFSKNPAGDTESTGGAETRSVNILLLPTYLWK